MGKELYRLKLKSLAYVSSVDTPAQETAIARLLKRKGGTGVSATARVAKLSDELGLVFGWALTTKADGVDYFDLQGDNVTEDDLIKIAAEWMSDGGAADTMHDREQDGRAVFCMPMTTEVAKAVYGDKVGGELGTYGLLVAIRPSPEDFAKFKSGELTGFSIDGTGVREPISDDKTARASRESPQAKTSPNVNPVSKETTVNELDELKALKAKLEAKIAELEAANTELKATAELTDGEKAHIASLSTSEAKRFRSLEKSARLAEVEKANEVAHTCIDGTVIRKSDGPTALKFARLADEALKTAQAEKSARETVELTKRASETIGKLAGRTQVHVALLKAAESIEGEIEIDGKKLKIADEAVKTLKAANDAMAERAKAPGFGGSQDEQPDGPAAELATLAKRYAEANKCDERTARLAVLKTEDGRRLYGEAEDLRKRKALGIQN